jgi:glycosyl hydrolase family 6
VSGSATSRALLIRLLLASLSVLGVVAPPVSARARGRAGANPLAGRRQFINCEALSSPNQGWNPWLRAHQARGTARTLLERLAKTPVTFSFAGTAAQDIGKRMERYMAAVDHPPLGGPDCRTPLHYSAATWARGPVPAADPRRRFTGGYPVLAIRSLDYRACKGGVGRRTDYKPFIDSFTKQLGRTWARRAEYRYKDTVRPPDSDFRPDRRRAAAIILEPDYLALIGAGKGCVSAKSARRSLRLMRYAVAKLTALPRVTVYIDAGEENWLSVGQAVRLLKLAGVGRARGFALNSTHTGTTRANLRYGNRIARRLGGAHYVINTAENAHGKLPRHWHGRAWSVNDSNCNPPNVGLGTPPTTHTASPYADAYLWISRPGISSNAGDRCRRGPATNVWWQHQALLAARNASFAQPAWPAPAL